MGTGVGLELGAGPTASEWQAGVAIQVKGGGFVRGEYVRSALCWRPWWGGGGTGVLQASCAHHHTSRVVSSAAGMRIRAPRSTRMPN